MFRWLRRSCYYIRYGPEEAGHLMTLSGDELSQRIRRLEDPEERLDSCSVFGLPGFEELLKLEEAIIVERETAVKQIVQKNRIQAKLQALEHRLAELQLDGANEKTQAEISLEIEEMKPYLQRLSEEVEALKRHVQKFEETTKVGIEQLRAQAMENVEELDVAWVKNRITELKIARLDAEKRLQLGKMARYEKEIKLLERRLAVTERPP